MSKQSFDPYSQLGIVFNQDGTIASRLTLPNVDPNPEPVPGNPTVSKDVVLKAQKDTSLRIIRPVRLPSNDSTVARLPIIIYFHGGGFVLYSSSDIMTNQNASQMATEIPSIVISVNYRLAPEHRLPACYEDAMDAILWVKQQALEPDGEEWLRSYGDFTRCYLYGRGSGGNIVFHVALKVADVDLGQVKICGLIFNQPTFGGVQRTKSEIKHAADHVLPLPVLDLLWDLSLPKGTDRNHRFSNPMMDGPTKEKVGSLPRSLVIGFGLDPTVDRQQEFVQMLAVKGVRVEAEFDDVGFHAIDVVDKRRSVAVFKIIQDFII